MRANQAVLLSALLALTATAEGFAFGSPLALRSGARRAAMRGRVMMQEDGGKGEGESEFKRKARELDEILKKSQEYDEGRSEGGPQPPPYSSPMSTRRQPDAGDFLRGKSLFDDENMRGRQQQMDPIRQQEWNLVNAFSQEKGFLAAIFGIVLLGCFYASVFTSGGLDGSARYLPDSVQVSSCDLESDPRCRY